MRSYLDTLLIDFLNTPLLQHLEIQLYRLLGPELPLHQLCLRAGLLLHLSGRAGRWWYSSSRCRCCWCVGSKGALIIRRAGAWRAWCWLCLRMFADCCRSVSCRCLGRLCGAGIVDRASRLRTITSSGFLGGVRGFLSNPLGRGIGAGGNLSLRHVDHRLEPSQQLGHTDVALESSVGVLLYQMGVFGALSSSACWRGSRSAVESIPPLRRTRSMRPRHSRF